jgi:hypothetical protein
MKTSWIFFGLLSLLGPPTFAAWKMDIERLKAEAFSRCQRPFNPPVIAPVATLDPPVDGDPKGEGMVYQEELSIRTTNLLDRDGFYFSPRPRAALNKLPMEIYVDNDKTGIYQRKTWKDANPDYSSYEIHPPILKSALPQAGRVLTELIVGHRSPRGDYPQLFDLRSNAYLRFAGYPPQVTGASLRLGAHNIFGPKEDFPIIRALFASVKNPKTAKALVLIESDLFCGALDMDMTEGPPAELLVDGFWYTRDNFNWKQEPNTGFVAYSSMLWKNEKQTPEIVSDEAHDSDLLTLKLANGRVNSYPLDPPLTGLRVRDLMMIEGPQAVEWTLANEDREPSHYADFEPALGDTNYNFRASYKVSLLKSNVKTSVRLYEQATDGEYSDNIVVASTLRQNIKKATRVEQFIRFKYKTTAFFPNTPPRSLGGQ